MNGTCSHCGETGPIVVKEKGWISSCYFRWYRAGKPDSGPPPRTRMRRADRQAEYAFLRSAGEDRATAGRRAGLRSPYRIREYERAWKAVA
jgi:hypothetical protein